MAGNTRDVDDLVGTTLNLLQPLWDRMGRFFKPVGRGWKRAHMENDAVLVAMYVFLELLFVACFGLGIWAGVDTARGVPDAMIGVICTSIVSTVLFCALVSLALDSASEDD